MQLSVVIPVYNDPEGLYRLLGQIAALGVFSQVVVVDDGSTVSCHPKDIGINPANYPVALKYHRLRKNRGAGYARNQGLRLASSSHVIFFDSDDLFTDNIVSLVADLQGRTFDFCIFKHTDSRVHAKGGYGLLDSDETCWQEAGAVGILGTLTPRGATHLCRIAAYPWNKIYRTEFLRSQNIRCTEISIHNDIEIHWISFLRAQSILFSDRICCEHFVAKGQSRLTNKTGRERFEVLQALAVVQREFATNPDDLPFLAAFVEFYTGLFGWITQQLEPSLHADFHREIRKFLRAELTPTLFTLATARNPVLGRRIIDLLRGQPL
jgi:glycosyltransferase involved in cell wall biosynthesis